MALCWYFVYLVIYKYIVRDKDFEVYNLNELEFVNGEVWVNVY